MTILAYGNRLDALARFEELEPRELVYIKDETEASSVELAMRWRTAARERKHLVFVLGKGLKPPKGLKPRPDRHLLIDELLAPWKHWAQQPGVELEDHCVDPAKIEQLLMAGSEAAGIPKFTAGAAEHFVNTHPGGLVALQGPLAMLKASEVKTPVSLACVRAQWPFRVIAGKVYIVDLMTLVRSLGTRSSLALVKSLPDNESYGALKGVEAVCVRKVKDELKKQLELLDLDTTTEPVASWVAEASAADLADRFCMIRGRSGADKLTCFAELERLQLLQQMFQAVELKRLRPRAALFLFCLQLLQEGQCPSKSKTGTSVSKLLSMSCQLSGIPC